MSWSSYGSKLVGAISTIVSAKHEVTRLLCRMQAHRVNKDRLLSSATGRTRELIRAVFNLYDRQIEASDWCWIKKKGTLYLIRMNNGYMINKRVRICEEERHDGIFPPFAALAASMRECNTNVDIARMNTWASEVSSKVTSWVSAYNNVYELEYCLSQLDALELDMASTLKL